jgi:hypothetical protein
MNRYLILKSIFRDSEPAYRGIERSDIPDIPSDIRKADLLNQTIEKYIEKRDLSVNEGEYLTDYHFASEIANSFTSYNDMGEKFEVVQIVYPDEIKPSHLTFLGYDVIGVNEYGSMIVDQLLRDYVLEQEYEKFKQELNKNFLFNELLIAKEFVKLVIRKIRSEISLRIIGLYIESRKN